IGSKSPAHDRGPHGREPSCQPASFRTNPANIGGTKMSTQVSAEATSQVSGPATTALRFEVTMLPVADVERAKAFYEGLGWRLDADFTLDDHTRIIQITPPASLASIQFGTGVTNMTAPLDNLY